MPPLVQMSAEVHQPHLQLSWAELALLSSKTPTQVKASQGIILLLQNLDKFVSNTGCVELGGPWSLSPTPYWMG